MFSKREGEQKQGEFWIESARVSQPKSQGFYSKLNEHLAEMDFARQVWALCAPAYCEESRGGRPGIDPVVYLKMLMVGFFENLRSERAIAARCEDSLSVRAFLGYGLEESTPDHSSLSVIRQRLGPEIYQGVFEVVLAALKAHGLFRGRHLGIDSSVIEANASLRTLVHRNTEEAYWEYVKELAAKEGVDPEDQGAVRRFDTKRPGRRTSNEEWKNPHDPQAKVGRTKDGACDMIYKPEHVTDLENGAIVQVEVLEGDHPRHEGIERAGRLCGGGGQPHRSQGAGWRRALAHRRQRLLRPRGNCPDPRVRYSYGNRGCPRCPASQESFERPAAQSSSSRRLCRQEPVWQSAFAQARNAPGTQL
jgi:transposase